MEPKIKSSPDKGEFCITPRLPVPGMKSNVNYHVFDIPHSGHETVAKNIQAGDHEVSPPHWRWCCAVTPLDHTNSGVLHLLALFFGDFQLRQVVRPVFVDVEKDVFPDAGS